MTLKRKFDINTVPVSEVPENWKAIDPSKTIVKAIACNFGFGEETIGFLEYSDETFEVGVGEPLVAQEYISLYKGFDAQVASEKFVMEIMIRAVEAQDDPDAALFVKTLRAYAKFRSN